jgi:hypothetical protein
MSNNFVFIVKAKSGKIIRFGQHNLMDYANRLPKGEIEIFDTKTNKPVGHMSMSALINKFG